MRECGLRAVPSSLVALPALHSLLMGYNLMTEVGGATVPLVAGEAACANRHTQAALVAVLLRRAS